MAARIKRGADKTFIIKLRKKNGDPVDLTNAQQVTVKIPKRDGTKLIINLDTIPAIAAFASYSGVVYSAVTAGLGGNAISLVFDGALTIQQVVDAWNTANPLNQVSSNASTPTTTVPVAQTVPLASGLDAYFKVVKCAPYTVGKLKVKLPYTDTVTLKVANQLAIEVILDSSLDQDIDDTGVLIPDAIDVYE